jgi:hypothetical protein
VYLGNSAIIHFLDFMSQQLNFVSAGEKMKRVTVLFVYIICIRFIAILIQDTFITFNRPCEAARQIGDGVESTVPMDNAK